MLRLHRAERSDVLADALAQLLRSPLDDPFTPEVVAVPAKGVERWLTQRLSRALGTDDGAGVAANLAFPSPTRLVDEAVAAASGVRPEDDPWAPARVLWALLRLVDECAGEPWCGVLAAHLGRDRGPDDPRTGRRYATAEHLRDLFRAYAAARPGMLVDWARGHDGDGTGELLPPDLRWQAELWRRLRAELAVPSPAERLDDTCARLRDDPATSDLPQRLSLFGATRTTAEQRAVLRALAAHREVHLWLPHPSPVMWTALDARRAVGGQGRRRWDDTSALAVAHPLLASLARDTRELQLLLADPAGGQRTDEHHVRTAPPVTLLQAVQAAVRDDAPPGTGPPPATGAPGAPPRTADRSVQVHACHGPSRQVEVLREALLHLFAGDRTLEPRDVLVLCPDVEVYAPLVRAAFGQPGAAHPGHRLRVRLADRSLRQTNPLLDVLSGLLVLADGRVTASQVLDLAASDPVRRAFGLRDDDLERLRGWAAATGVRWGIGRQQREAHALQAVPQNTWDTALDRLLLGVAADETDLAWLGLALPLDDVDSSDIELAGRLAELVQRLGAVLGRLHGRQPAGAWAAALSDALDLLTDVTDEDAWQLDQARRQLREAVEHGGDVELRLADVRALLAGRLAGRPTRANFRTGELTVCSMVPMRSVPHRVVALLGLDDGVFPRAGSVDGDDVLQRDPWLGERDVRSEDRQLLLDAVLSASDSLLLLYTGADPVTGAVRPPSVPLGEVLDVLRRTVGDPELAGVLRRHPLQPFDGADFAADDPFSFDPAALAGARTAVAERRPEPPLLDAPLSARCADVALSDLVAFLVAPARAFLQRRLGVRVPDREDAVADALSAELDALQQWDLGERMLTARMAGVDAGDFRQAEWRRGTLPPGPLGMRLLSEVEAAVEPLLQASLPVHAGRPRTVDIAVDLGPRPGGPPGDVRRLSGTVPGVHGSVLASTSYSRLAPKHRLPAWARLVAVAADGGQGVHTAVTTGRGPFRRPVWRSTLHVPDDPHTVLRGLVALYDEGMREPVPLAAGASAEYAARRERGGTVEEALAAAQEAWGSRFGDVTDRHVSWVHGPDAPFARLLTAPADGPEPTRFGALALRLWAPLLAHETVGAP